ncbi:DHH family phosphoesterase [Candidatus Woesearchaeota archaeon]|nr:DHH family phosphoesterase [Candidatus Woesearchaeota archaeon]
MLKGKTKEVLKAVKILTRLEHPDEILEQKSAAGRFIYKHFSAVNDIYAPMLKKALETKPEGGVYTFIYSDYRMSITKDLANELSHKMPDKLIVIGREKSDEVKLSLRWNKNIVPVLEKALEGVDGYGGGHKYACGAAIKKNDFKKFIKQLKENI